MKTNAIQCRLDQVHDVFFSFLFSISFSFTFIVYAKVNCAKEEKSTETIDLDLFCLSPHKKTIHYVRGGSEISTNLLIVIVNHKIKLNKQKKKILFFNRFLISKCIHLHTRYVSLNLWIDYSFGFYLHIRDNIYIFYSL